MSSFRIDSVDRVFILYNNTSRHVANSGTFGKHTGEFLFSKQVNCTR